MAIGGIMAFCLVSTDDYYVMELHQNHPMNWKGFIIAGIFIAAGWLIYWISSNYYIHIGRKHESHKRYL